MNDLIERLDREPIDLMLLTIFIFFAIYKGVRLVKTTRLGWSFATYNFVLASLFIITIYLVPLLDWPTRVENAMVTIGRTLLVLSIIWCVIEVEASRRDLLEFGLRRRGSGQQT